MAIKINQSVTANGNVPSNAGVDHPGGPGTMSFHGTIDGATVKLQSSVDGGTTWVDVADDDVTASLTIAGDKGYTLTRRKLRVNVAGGGGSLSGVVELNQDRREFVGTEA